MSLEMLVSLRRQCKQASVLVSLLLPLPLLPIDENFMVQNSLVGAWPIQVEVRVLQHGDWRWRIRRGLQFNYHLIVLCERVGRACIHCSWIPLAAQWVLGSSCHFS